MKRNHVSYYRSFAMLSALVFALTAFVVASSGKKQKQIDHTNERELKVMMEAALGDVYITKGKGDIIIKATVEADRSFNMDDCIDYEIRDKIGYLNFVTDCEEGGKKHKKSNVHMNDLASSDWWLDITDDIPVSFDLELGLGKADLNLTGLAVKDLNLSAGASSVKLRFDEPNTSVIEDMSIEAGLSKFTAVGLGNANFNHFKFEGGVGSYSLDFSGKLDHEVDVDVEIGLGSVTIIVPKNTGAKVFCEKNWISHLNIDDDFKEREDDTYYTANYKSAEGKMNIHIEAGLGSVKVRRK
ncbi:MAG: hypothetical protein HYZ34_02350 [Ignavibacteriae bacterium]|nr:hypothetical protein [Ignavibacteriota bacterium]